VPPAAAWLLACLLLACGGDDDTGGQLLAPARDGLIEGRIEGPDGGIPMDLWLRPITGPALDRPFWVQATADSTGGFRFAVPFGGYALDFVASKRETFRWWSDDARPDPDTLWVNAARPTARADVRLGALRLRIPVPDLWVGEPPRLRVSRTGPGFLLADFEPQGRATSGQFEWVVAGLPPGRYLLFLRMEHGPIVPLPYGSTIGSADRVEVLAERWNEFAYVLPPPALLTGTAAGSWERLRPLLDRWSNAQIAFYDDDSVLVGSCGTDLEGRFRLATYALGPVRGRMEVNDIQRWIGGTGFTDATRFPLAAGTETVVPVEPDGGVLFHLSLEGTPIYQPANAWLDVRDGAGAPIASVDLSCRMCGEWGNLAAVANLRAGTYRVRIVSWDGGPGWPTQWYDRAAIRADAADLRIAGGELLELDWSLREGGSLVGALLAGTGPWPDEATVCAFAAGDTIEPAGQGDVDPSTGAFRFGGLLPGAHLVAVRVTRDGADRWWWYPGVSTAAAAESVRIEAGITAELGPWELPR